jgi:branched-chain amino acid aminotransferase
MFIAIKHKPNARPLSDLKREAILANPGFGRHFTDHMVTIRWTEGRGWYDAQLIPYGPFSIDPANRALHYGQEIFEGLKAYRQPDGSVAVFRPDANAERFQASARRLAMPELPVETFIAACDALVSTDRAWVPNGNEQSLYLRPFMFATEVGIGSGPATEYLFVVIASPSGSYFPGGMKPVSVWLSEDYVRSVPGGTGAAKAAGNYAGSYVAQAEAYANGCGEVVWLDAHERRWIEEMGAMNLYFVYGARHGKQRILTPALNGSLLPGITRASLLRIAADLGHEVSESRISVEDWRSGTSDGSLTEVFACGTAAVVTPVGSVKTRRTSWIVGDGQPGEVTMTLRKALLGIQTGTAPDEHAWMHRQV